MMDGPPTITVYLNEIDYPFMKLKMPLSEYQVLYINIVTSTVVN